MKKRTQIILVGLVVFFGLIQFIRPDRNEQTNPSPDDIFYKADADVAVESALKSSCYDCHSNLTNYPWYAGIAPVSWAIGKHVKKGKKHLNFSEWAQYSTDRQAHKLDEVVEVLRENEMPPGYYKILHPAARFDEATKQMLISWAEELKTKIESPNTENE